MVHSPRLALDNVGVILSPPATVAMVTLHGVAEIETIVAYRTAHDFSIRSKLMLLNTEISAKQAHNFKTT